jgi:hypothetical protein
MAGEQYRETIKRFVERCNGMVPFVVAVDEGLEGAVAVMEDGKEAIHHEGWSVGKPWDRGGAGELARDVLGAVSELPEMWDCNVLLVHEAPVSLKRYSTNAGEKKTAIQETWKTAASAFIVAGILAQMGCSVEILSVPPSWWRAPLGIPCRSKEAAKIQAMWHANHCLGVYTASEHEAEAACMASMVMDLVKQQYAQEEMGK